MIHCAMHSPDKALHLGSECHAVSCILIQIQDIILLKQDNTG